MANQTNQCPPIPPISQQTLPTVISTWSEITTSNPTHAYTITNNFHSHLIQQSQAQHTTPWQLLQAHLQQWHISPDWIQPYTYPQTLHVVMACQHHTLTHTEVTSHPSQSSPTPQPKPTHHPTATQLQPHHHQDSLLLDTQHHLQTLTTQVAHLW